MERQWHEFFLPAVRDWFDECVGPPTDVQQRAWPKIAAGDHVLVTAPTGSGKTLTAFLWALNQLLARRWPSGMISVLYVSPLKALNNDIQRNLLQPLKELTQRMNIHPLPASRRGSKPRDLIRVAVRSGSTPPAERRRMLREPPEIFITTPESLNIILASPRGRELFNHLRTVILDEVHAVIGAKRGVHLITAIDRLVQSAGEFQRIALSATVSPLDEAARWVGGYQLLREDDRPVYRERDVVVVRSGISKRYDIEVRYVQGADEAIPLDGVEPGTIWPFLTKELKDRIRANRSTLVFANSRRMVEKLTRFINEGEPRELAYPHHGSLSREVRAVVEAKLKAGELAAVVATNSLELGIDIGALDEVLLVQTPPSAAATVQRVGRAGHSVGGVSRSKIYPLFPRDILDAAVATKLLLNGEIEPLAPVTNALDILAQILLSLTAAVTWQADALYDMVRATYPFRHLPRTQFDLVLNLLAGRYAETRIRELRPLILVDKLAGTVRARPESAKRLFLAGGTIPDRGQYTLRLANSNAKLGELDEEFVWERSVGDTFTLGVQTWRIDRVTHNDVLVSPAAKRAAMAPFWRADERDRSNFFTSRIGEFLEWIEPLLEDPALPGQLQREFFLDARAAKNLVQWLIFAKSVLGGRLPHRRRIVVERVAGETGSGEDGIEYLVHTFWGGRVNRPFALALSAAWEERYGAPLAIQHDDDALVVTSPGDINPGDLLRLVQPDRIEPLIRGKLGQTGYFGAKFREAAGRAMLLPKQSFRHRLPLWRLRERAKGLLQAVAKFADFPIILEAWRECLTDVFEIAALRSLLSEIQDGAIDVLVVSTRTPSPFASHLVWLRTNKLMYEDDVPPSSAAAAPGGDIIAEIARAADVRAAGSRPKIPELLCQTVQAKLQRTAPGYAPRDVDELLAWVSERVMIPKNEWRELTAAVQRDHNVNLTEWDQTLASRLVTVVLPQGHADGAVCHIEDVPGLLATLALERAAVTLTSLDSEPLPAETEPVLTASFTAAQRDGRLRCDVAQRLGQWLRFYGPVPIARVAAQWGASSDFYQALQTLIADGIAVTGELSAGAGAVEVCDLQNLERLLRGLRQASRPQFQPLAASLLPLLLAQWHGLNSNLTGEEGLARAFERLAGLPAPADLWETEILPARIREYSPVGLDALVTGCGLAWIGCGPRWLTFGSPDGRQLLGALVEPPEQLTDATVTGADMMADQVPEQTAAWPGSQLVDRVFPAGAGRFTFSELLEQSGMSPADLTRALWTLAWSGQITNSTFQAVRQGLAHGFQPAEPILQTGGNDRRPKLRFGQWRQTRAFSGAWHRLPDVPPAGDPLAEDELAKERARLALEHFGIVFRELLARELPALQWPRIFRALRLMELSGEVLSGAFFQGIPGPQFILPAAFALLRDGLNGDLSFWLNAADPAAPCGLGLTGLPSGLPKRMTANHLSFVGERLAFVSERGGRRLTISVTPGDPRLPDVIQPLVSAFTRRVQPRQVLIIEEINGEPAARSPFSTAFAGLFHVENEREGLRIRAYF